MMARSPAVAPLEMVGRRVALRTLAPNDYGAWIEVRTRCRDWLVPWEPRPHDAPPVAEDRGSFAARCAIRDRERQMGTGFGFGIFAQQRFVGEVTLSSIQRGPFQSGYVGYWIDRDVAGLGLVPEAVVMVLHFAFEAVSLHRVEISIIPRNRASLRVVEKLGLRMEGVAERFLEINGRWEDHARFAITAEEWAVRRQDLLWTWLGRV
ncbi:MAG: GNAT family protein [Actinomycetota bacterium]|jgi:ribosomal-protein-alanine N-acetyltransferase|nr:GNAT family protein [Actinomycetota bacterium]